MASRAMSLTDLFFNQVGANIILVFPKRILQEEGSTATISLTASRAISLPDFKNYTPSILKMLCIFYDPRCVAENKIYFTLLYVKIMSFSILLIVSKRISNF